MVWGVDDDPFFALIELMIGLIDRMVAGLIHDVQRVQARKHGNGGLNDHVLHGRNGCEKPLFFNQLVRFQEVLNFFRFQIHVV